jgi:hypothetical protein
LTSAPLTISTIGTIGTPPKVSVTVTYTPGPVRLYVPYKIFVKNGKVIPIEVASDRLVIDTIGMPTNP